MKKRIISLGLSLAMVLTSANSIFAASTTITGTPAGNSLPYTSSEATGKSDLTYLDSDITTVTLPTSALDFSMDPQGIIGATKAVAANTSLTTDAAKQSEFTRLLPTYAGRIYGTNILTIKNEGANEVEVGVSVVASVKRNDSEAKKTELLTNINEVKNTERLDDAKINPASGNDKEKANIISLDVAYTGYKEDTPANTDPATGDKNEGIVKFKDKADNNVIGEKILGFEPFEGSAATIAGYAGFDEAGSKITFKFDEDITYGIKYGAPGSNGKPTASVASGVTNTDTTKDLKTKGVSVGFAISGRLNKNADWSDYVIANGATNPNEEITVKAIYNVAPISGGNDTVAEDGDRTGNNVECGIDATVSAITGASLAITSANNDPSQEIVFTFTPGIMDSTVALDSSVAPKIDNNTVALDKYTAVSEYYVFSGNTLTIKPLFFTAGAATSSSKVTVQGNDGKSYSVNLS